MRSEKRFRTEDALMVMAHIIDKDMRHKWDDRKERLTKFLKMLEPCIIVADALLLQLKTCIMFGHYPHGLTKTQKTMLQKMVYGRRRKS